MLNPSRTLPALLLAFFALTAATPPADAPLHFGLSKSSPEAGSTVSAPSTVTLWFTQVPQEGTVQIRIVEADDAGVHVMDAVQDPEDAMAFSIELHGTLPAATYTVSWRGMGEDGHVVRDTFQFTVAAE